MERERETAKGKSVVKWREAVNRDGLCNML